MHARRGSCGARDDNGNRFVIGRFASAEAAEAEQRRFEALAHKQTYWIQPAAVDEAGDHALPERVLPDLSRDQSS